MEHFWLVCVCVCAPTELRCLLAHVSVAPLKQKPFASRHDSRFDRFSFSSSSFSRMCIRIYTKRQKRLGIFFSSFILLFRRTYSYILHTSTHFVRWARCQTFLNRANKMSKFLIWFWCIDVKPKFVVQTNHVLLSIYYTFDFNIFHCSSDTIHYIRHHFDIFDCL